MQCVKFGSGYSVKCLLVMLYFSLYRRGAYTILVYPVAQLVESLLYMSEGRGFETRWQHYGTGGESDSNRNEYKVYFMGSKDGRCVGLTTLPSSCADCLEIWDPQPTGIC